MCWFSNRNWEAKEIEGTHYIEIMYSFESLKMILVIINQIYSEEIKDKAIRTRQV